MSKYDEFEAKAELINVLLKQLQVNPSSIFATERLSEYQNSVIEGCEIPWQYGTFGPELCVWCDGTLIWDGDPEDIAMDEKNSTHNHRGACPMCWATGLEKHTTS